MAISLCEECSEIRGNHRATFVLHSFISHINSTPAVPRMVSGVSIRAAPKRPSVYVRVVVNRLAYKFYEGPVTVYGDDRAILCFY